MRTRKRRPGRSSLLTPERIDTIAKTAALGGATSLAAEAAGVSRATLARWMARGRNAAEARQGKEPADPSNDVYVELYRRVNTARAQMAARALTRVLQAEAGSLVLEERVRTYTDPDTDAEVEERQVRYLRPDWRASAWWLARVFPEHYGPNTKSFDHLLDEFDTGHPAADPDEPRLAELAERLTVTLAHQDAKLPAPPLPRRARRVTTAAAR